LTFGVARMAELDYVLLPRYDIPNAIVVSGLLVENHTAKPVKNVRIHIEVRSVRQPHPPFPDSFG